MHLRLLITRYRSLTPKPADKPGSVPIRDWVRSSVWGDGCPSPLAAYPGLGWDGPPRRPCLALLPMGDTWPLVSPRAPVVSYTTFSPLLRRHSRLSRLLFCGPFPRVARAPAWVLPSTVPYGARTFLAPCKLRSHGTRPPGRLGRQCYDNTRPAAVKDHFKPTEISLHRRIIDLKINRTLLLTIYVERDGIGPAA
jgi:hypothetical protein